MTSKAERIKKYYATDKFRSNWDRIFIKNKASKDESLEAEVRKKDQTTSPHEVENQKC